MFWGRGPFNYFNFIYNFFYFTFHSSYLILFLILNDFFFDFRVLHRVSKPVPNDQLLYYLKAYDDVTNEIRIKPPDPDSWETWCSERYDCNNTDTK